jgi:hypothetical protein
MAPSNPPRKILMVVTVGGYTHAGKTASSEFPYVPLIIVYSPGVGARKGARSTRTHGRFCHA